MVLWEKMLGEVPSDNWVWEVAGDFQLESGKAIINVHDLTGYYGRFASIILTTDFAYTPPQPIEDIWKERARIKGKSTEAELVGEYDLVVVGGGSAGIPAAIAAARSGARTALIHNRPVPGGNASIEAGVSFNGASARQPNAREGGIAEEIRRMRDHYGLSWTDALERLIKKAISVYIITVMFWSQV